MYFEKEEKQEVELRVMKATFASLPLFSLWAGLSSRKKETDLRKYYIVVNTDNTLAISAK